MKNEFPQYSCPIEVEARISLQDFFQVFFSQSKLSFDDNWPITGLESGNIEKKMIAAAFTNHLIMSICFIWSRYKIRVINNKCTMFEYQ